MEMNLDTGSEAFVRAQGTLWAAVFRDPSSNLHERGTMEAIEAVEAKTGVTFPAGHREFLIRANGGQAGHILYLGIGDDRDDDLLWHAVHLRPDFEKTAGKPVLPFARNWGGDYYCYDLSRPQKNGDFPVLYWYHAAADRGESGAKIWSEAAPGFLAFLAHGLKNQIEPPAIVLTENGAEYWFDGALRSTLEWSRVRRIAVEVVIDDDSGYYEAFWMVQGPGMDFRAPVGLALDAELLEAWLCGFKGFDQHAYREARKAAGRPDAGVFVCWSREPVGP